MSQRSAGRDGLHQGAEGEVVEVVPGSVGQGACNGGSGCHSGSPK